MTEKYSHKILLMIQKHFFSGKNVKVFEQSKLNKRLKKHIIPEYLKNLMILTYPPVHTG